MIGRALAGVRVLDASRVLAGPLAGQILSDLGADVVKIEDPAQGDETRAWGPPFAASGLSAYFMSCNRGKRGVTLNLKDARGKELFDGLCRKSDVVLQNFRHDSAVALGVSPEQLLRINQRLVSVAISGFGDGPLFGDRPGYDFAVQGMSGLMAMTGPTDGAPHKAGVAIVDVVTGLYAVIAVLAGLKERDRSGSGLMVDLALIDCAVSATVNVAQAYLTSGAQPRRQGNAHLQIVPYELFATADGFLVLAVGNDAQWQRFCRAAGRADLAENVDFARNEERVKRRAVLVPQVAAVMATRTTAAWQDVLDAAGVPNGPVWTTKDLFASELEAERRLKVQARHADGTVVDLLRSPLWTVSEAQARAVMPPPGKGEHTEAVLQELLGLSAGEVGRLKEAGVV